MLEIKKSYVVDENQNPIAVQIPLDDFNKIANLSEANLSQAILTASKL